MPKLEFKMTMVLAWHMKSIGILNANICYWTVPLVYLQKELFVNEIK